MDKATAIKIIKENYKNVFPQNVLDMLLYLFTGGLADSDNPGETYNFTDVFEGELTEDKTIWDLVIPVKGYAIIYVESQIYTTYTNVAADNLASQSIKNSAYKALALRSPESIDLNPATLYNINAGTELVFVALQADDTDITKVKVTLSTQVEPNSINRKTQYKVKINVIISESII